MAEIGKRIRLKREEMGITQEELAKRLGYKSKTTIAKIENGTNDIVQSKVVDFANALETTPAFLMGWTDSEVAAVSKICTELNVIQTRTNLYIQLFETYGHKIKLRNNSVDVLTRNGVNYTFDRTDFMSMIQRCHKDLTYNFDRLIDEYERQKTFNVDAAHERTDIETTTQGKQHDNDIMDNDSEWSDIT